MLASLGAIRCRGLSDIGTGFEACSLVLIARCDGFQFRDSDPARFDLAHGPAPSSGGARETTAGRAETLLRSVLARADLGLLSA